MNDISGLKFYIHTFGCQMNENDSERIAGQLKAAGATKAERLEDGQIIIVNTCAVRAKSEDKLFSYLGRLRAQKNKRQLLIGLAGCVAQLYREELLSKNPDIDFIVGPDNYHRLPGIISQNLTAKPILAGWAREWNEAERRPILRESPVSAFVTIMEGCDNFCSYCIVPFTRGREKFRPLRAILEEIDSLALAGYREVQFLGQNVNSYKDPETGALFQDLLEAADRLEGIEWIRFITSHPKNFSSEIIAAMSRSRHVCRQIHLPLQSGSSSVLERMRRRYTRDEYLERLREIRLRLPEISLSTDIIVGFPGETEPEFEETLSALEEIRFANIFSFRYSPRPRTAAAKLDDDVPFEVKRRRLQEVQARQKKIQSEIHQGFIGRTIKVLCLGKSKKDERVYSGRSEGSQVVNFRSPADVIGRFVHVAITDAGPYSLRGDIRE
ncbi:MAG: tRNA (N6-isopentenyl adenosine(37)-C2)-methylthiotransferase MiaB [Candidatus Aminicenantales bacterium]